MNLLRKWWRWSTEIPEDPTERLRRAQELITVSKVILVIGGIITAINVAVAWTQVLSVLKALR